MEGQGKFPLRDAAPGKTFRALSAVLSVIMGLFFGYVFWFSLTAAGEPAALMPFFALLVCLALVWVGRHRGTALPSHWRRAAAACGLLLLLAVQVRFAKAIYGNVHYDFRTVYDGALALARDGTLGGLEAYFATFPNNLLLTVVFAAVMKLCAWLGFTNLMGALTAGSMLAVDASAVMAWLCARRLWGERAARTALLFSIPLCVLHYGIVTPYSDTFGMFFLMLLLTLYVYLPEKEGPALAFAALMGVAAAVGYKIKPQTIIILAAVALAELFFRRLTKERLLFLGKRLLCFTLAAATALAGIGAVTRAATRQVISDELMEAREIPFTHYLMMGCNPESYGMYNAGDYEATLRFAGKRDRIAYNLRVTGERLKAFGPKGYAEFLLAKGRITFFSMDIDMWARLPAYRQDPLSLAIQETFLRGGARFPLYLQFLQALWVVLLGLLLLALAVCPKSRWDKTGVVLRLEVMGFALFQMLFENGARYRFHQTPVFILLGAWGMAVLPEGLAGSRRRLTSLRARKKE